MTENHYSSKIFPNKSLQNKISLLYSCQNTNQANNTHISNKFKMKKFKHENFTRF